ncbi:MAG TPA: nuclear transport factor 2 family protein [Desulfuromonadales bacterium]|nr:nuclear transport factor 2 family protein [Desulfuromonadales bacterium]
MMLVQDAITGKEGNERGTSPYQALVQFYRAFNAGDPELMSENWAHSEEIAMDNPLGGIKRGWPDIEEVYKRIFNGPTKVYVEFYDYTIHETADTFYDVGRERGDLRINDDEIPFAIRTSRIFRKIDGRWRQVHHHGSIDDPGLLDRYQRAVARV